MPAKAGIHASFGQITARTMTQWIRCQRVNASGRWYYAKTKARIR
jgi:hypothetical protein